MTSNSDATQPSHVTHYPSATAHNVYADNREEDIFGWIQPEEWDTVAGVNKDNFLRGDCVECNAGPNTALESCGGPSCGYGAQCCEYSRRSTRTNLASSHPASVYGSRNMTIPDMVKNEKKSSLGVSLVDIIHGRSCRPISLLDLRTFLHLQRDPHRRLAAYSPASDMQSSTIPDFDLNDTPVALPSTKSTSALRDNTFHDEVDALDFLVAYERYVNKFREQSKALRMRSPDPLTCKVAVQAYIRRQHKDRTSQELTVAESQSHGDVSTGEASPEAVQAILAKLKPTDLGLKPDKQPLRVEFDQLVLNYLCNQRSCVPDPRKRAYQFGFTSRGNNPASSYESVSITGTSDDGKINTGLKMPRVRWMLGVGLISEEVLQLALAECDFSTHPDVLAPVAESVYAYMSQHVIPYFFISVSRNIGTRTKRGRFMVGAACTIVALLFSILLIVTPSPLAPRAGNNYGHISRWWRLLTAPLWCAGLGYILAYFTGLCVWLTLRGNREPDEEEERERSDIRSRLSTDDALGFDLGELQDDVDQRNSEIERETNRWMAPELADLLLGMTGQKKKAASSGNRSLADVESVGATERQLHRSVSAANGEKDMVKREDSATRRSESAVRPLASSNAAPTSAAVIMNTPRRITFRESFDHPVTTRSIPARSNSDLVRGSLEGPGLAAGLTARDDELGVLSKMSSPSSKGGQRRSSILKVSLGKSAPPTGATTSEPAVFTRDALLFDPELASEYKRSRRASTDLDPLSTSPISRTKSPTSGLLPVFRSGRRKQNLSFEETAEETKTAPSDNDLVVEPFSRGGAEIAPWPEAPAGVKSADLPAATRELLFSTSSTSKARQDEVSRTKKSGLASLRQRSHQHFTSSEPFKVRFWKAVQRGTGFAVGTERVLDSRVRRAQQIKALRIMAMNTLATIVVMVIVLVIP